MPTKEELRALLKKLDAKELSATSTRILQEFQSRLTTGNIEKVSEEISAFKSALVLELFDRLLNITYAVDGQLEVVSDNLNVVRGPQTEH